MARVTRPLERLGAAILSAPGDRLPLTIRGACPALPLSHRTIAPSAQVKSALLLAALNTAGATEIIEPVPTRDHSERLLKLFGAALDVQEGPQGERHIRLHGEAELRPRDLKIPGDLSAAAFLIVAALVVPGSWLRLEGIGVNPMRTGLLDMLRNMGGQITLSNHRDLSGEPVADIEVRHSRLAAVDVPAEAVPAMIDEFPAFFIAAAFAEGTSRARGLAELRVKESDRIAAMAAGLGAIGVAADEQEDGLAIRGSGGAALPGGALIDPHLDHRVAMSFAVAGLHSKRAISLADMSPADTSFPGFAAALAGLAAA
jgi:3-phosphoshikimate 1-carboxyvinyltransferase